MSLLISSAWVSPIARLVGSGGDSLTIATSKLNGLLLDHATSVGLWDSHFLVQEMNPQSRPAENMTLH